MLDLSPKAVTLRHILIVCTGNICRSPMAEGLLKSMWPSRLNPQPVINSAGTHAFNGLPAEPYAIHAVSEYGVDISSHRSRVIDAALIERADLILAMEQQHVDSIRNATGGGAGNVGLLGDLNAAGPHVEIPDPYGGSPDTYRECARMIKGCLERLVIHLRRNSTAI
jgi:protein-tyrosine phosphatase